MDKNCAERTCKHCHTVFSKKNNLNLHMKRKHLEEFQQLKRTKFYLCEKCGNHFNTSAELKNHHRSHDTPNRKPRIVYTCPICGTTAKSKPNIMLHFRNGHDITMAYDILEFATLGDFHSWKLNVEKNRFLKFIKKRGSRQCHDVTNMTFYCHLSGNFRTTAEERLKMDASFENNAYCPADIKVKLFGERCEVLYCKTHVGHSTNQ